MNFDRYLNLISTRGFWQALGFLCTTFYNDALQIRNLDDKRAREKEIRSP